MGTVTEVWSKAFRGLGSRDLSLRWMSLIFLGSWLGIIGVGFFGYQLYHKRIQYKKELSESELTAKNLSGFFEKQSEHAKRKYTLFGIGDFTVELKPIPNQKAVKGVLNMAELELVAECDTRVTCNYLEQHLHRVRDQVASVFFAIDREELVSKEGKKRLRQSIVERINSWLPNGKIQNIFMTKLIVS